MPYISPDGNKRAMLDTDVYLAMEDITNKGELNYFFTKVLITYIGTRPKYSYEELTNARSVLMDVYGEFTRRVLDPYEDMKCEENGDVY